MKKPFNEDEDFYYNPEGYIVLTEEYHLARGYCCGNGCKHCPYDYKNVPEPRRSKLLEERKRTDEQKNIE
jgi:hypothetical protein